MVATEYKCSYRVMSIRLKHFHLHYSKYKVVMKISLRKLLIILITKRLTKNRNTIINFVSFVIIEPDYRRCLLKMSIFLVQIVESVIFAAFLLT